MNKELRTVKINEVTLYYNNPRINGNAVSAVMESIKQCGYVAPIVCDENMEILAGHTRFEALIQIGKKEVEVLVCSGLTEEQKKKCRILDNKTNELAEWDFEKLAEELKDLDFGDFDFGFEIDDEQEEYEPERKEISVGDNEYQIIIDCINESDMEVKYNFLRENDIECRLSTL